MGIDLTVSCEIDIDVGDSADFVIFGSAPTSRSGKFRSRKTIQDLVYDPSQDRTTVFNGEIVSG